jgi:hypothetical protein
MKKDRGMTFTELSWVEHEGGGAPADRSFLILIYLLSHGVRHVPSYTNHSVQGAD